MHEQEQLGVSECLLALKTTKDPLVLQTLEKLVENQEELFVNDFGIDSNNELCNLLPAIGHSGLEHLVPLLCRNKNLKLLNLGLNNIGNKGLETLAELVKTSRSLEELDLVSNNFNGIGISKFAPSIEPSSLKMLVLSRNNIGDDAMSLLCTFVLKSRIEILTLDYTQITLKGVTHIAEMLQFSKTLRAVDLSANDIDCTGAAHIASALSTSKVLLELDLHGIFLSNTANSISDRGASALSKALLKNKSLRSLNLEENDIGDSGSRCLADMIRKSTTLSVLQLTDNVMSDSGALCILDAFKLNHTLSATPLKPTFVGEDVTPERTAINEEFAGICERNCRYLEIMNMEAIEMMRCSRALMMLDGLLPKEVLMVVFGRYARLYRSEDWRVVRSVLCDRALVGKVHDDKPFSASSLLRLCYYRFRK